MQFDQDAFISYAHIDNEALPTEKEGWVTLFDQTLQQLLAQAAGKKVRVWRDSKLAGNDEVTETILSKFAQTAVLVSVLSPRYVQSEWCRKEILRFYDEAKKNLGLVIGNKSRIFKVIKTPLDDDMATPEALTDILRDMTGYAFYEPADDKPPKPYDPAFGENEKRAFLVGVQTVAWHIKQLLKAMATPAQTTPLVYLAECSRDRRDERQIVAAELTRLGYSVVPETDLPRDETDFTAEVERLLSRCVLAIHFVGDGYGAVPDGITEKSVVILQNEIAVRVSKSGHLRRVISLPAAARGANPAQQAFIDALHADAEMQFGADLITGGIEDVKSAIHSALKELEGGDEQPPAVETLIYIICDPRDPQATVPLVKSLVARGTRVELTVFDGEAATVREANEKLATEADVIILFYGEGDERWKVYQRSDITKIRGLRRNNPPRTFVYIAAPSTPNKDFIVETEKNVLDGRVGFSDQMLGAIFGADQ
jgi:hypothetical protein